MGFHSDQYKAQVLYWSKQNNCYCNSFLTITKPIWLDTDVSFLAFKVICWAGRVLWTAFVCFIWSSVILTVINSVTNLWLWNASAIEAREFTVDTWWICATFFIRAIYRQKWKLWNIRISHVNLYGMWWKLVREFGKKKIQPMRFRCDMNHAWCSFMKWIKNCSHHIETSLTHTILYSSIIIVLSLLVHNFNFEWSIYRCIQANS